MEAFRLDIKTNEIRTKSLMLKTILGTQLYVREMHSCDLNETVLAVTA